MSDPGPGTIHFNYTPTYGPNNVVYLAVKGRWNTYTPGHDGTAVTVMTLAVAERLREELDIAIETAKFMDSLKGVK